ncbi:hypothetical protein AB4144_32100, partial [Rhizobiaceae sp. 2RAB30]
MTDQQAAAARAERENAWATHRKALDKTTADAFETLLRQDDLVTNARLGRAGEVERLNQTVKSLVLVEAALAEKLEAKSIVEVGLLAVKEEIAAATKTMSPDLPHDMGPTELEGWLFRREQVLEAARLQRQAEREAREAEEDGKALAERLAAALSSAGISYWPNVSADMLMAEAQSALDRQAEHAALARRNAELKANLNLRSRALAEANAAEAAWHRDLAAACADTWLAGALPDVAGVREIVERLAELEPILRDCDSLADRIAKMEQDQAAFVEE